MSIGTIKNVLERIQAATPSSPIQVFTCDKPGCLDARFGATMHGATAQSDPGYIGTFDATMNRDECLQILIRNAR